VNYTRRAVANESETEPPPQIQWQELRSIIFTGADLLDSRPNLGPAGIPTPQFEAWITRHLAHIPREGALWSSERRDLINYDNFSIHQMDAIVELIQEGSLFGPWDAQRP
jgi:hypothetical protein